jgi:hypothetical protein
MSIASTPAPERVSNNSTAEQMKHVDRVVITRLVEEKSSHTPNKFPWKQAQTQTLTHRIKKVHPVVTAERRDRLFQQDEELMRAMTLRKIKRRLFLEAVNADISSQ